MNRPDLNALSKEVYKANKEKGFHDMEHNNETLLMLVITELSEAVEADRKGERADLERMFSEIKERRSDINDLLNGKILARPHVINEAKEELEIDTFKRFFEYRVKDTIEDELAGATIRLLDLAGLRKYHIFSKEGTLAEYVHCSPIDEKFSSFVDHVFAVVKLICGNYDIEFTPSEIVELSILSIEHICNTLSIDLWQHVSIKLKYNQNRPHKHGKAY
ncbi:nucleoside triphosphate pyrophosphohydrolase family protein [Dysgonomonas macrotermitis]|uniref:MazG nucleotide pyrophosphohydrolase domain-containing protein n=1 Tax=Dysgonomonas macrotermitis TaxID=1346286 RepID=A0A1M4SBI7_9BACT|nr:hypothetical protein [Dysgonomonas macrotermitis]SHE29505.1 hypothetical protein SAMN05444362_10110 [Dysgonomonas macrotermitis]